MELSAACWVSKSRSLDIYDGCKLLRRITIADSSTCEVRPVYGRGIPIMLDVLSFRYRVGVWGGGRALQKSKSFFSRFAACMDATSELF